MKKEVSIPAGFTLFLFSHDRFTGFGESQKVFVFPPFVQANWSLSNDVSFRNSESK